VTRKQQRFCMEYLVDLNASQAAIRAGYSTDTAGAIGFENLKKPEIAKRVEELQAERSIRTSVTQDRTLRELARIAFFDIRKAFHPDGSLKPLAEMDEATAACIAGLEAENIYAKDAKGKLTVTGRIFKIKLANKLGALDTIARHLGMFVDKTTMELTGKDGQPLLPPVVNVHFVTTRVDHETGDRINTYPDGRVETIPMRQDRRLQVGT